MDAGRVGHDDGVTTDLSVDILWDVRERVLG